MGHYRSEMSCERCGEPRCVCPRKPDKPDVRWVVASDFEVLQGYEWLAREKNRKLPADANAMEQARHYVRKESLSTKLMMMEHFDTKVQAERHAVKVINDMLAEREADIRKLRKIRMLFAHIDEANHE